MTPNDGTWRKVERIEDIQPGNKKVGTWQLSKGILTVGRATVCRMVEIYRGIHFWLILEKNFIILPVALWLWVRQMWCQIQSSLLAIFVNLVKFLSQFPHILNVGNNTYLWGSHKDHIKCIMFQRHSAWPVLGIFLIVVQWEAWRLFLERQTSSIHYF